MGLIKGDTRGLDYSSCSWASCMLKLASCCGSFSTSASKPIPLQRIKSGIRDESHVVWFRI